MLLSTRILGLDPPARCWLGIFAEHLRWESSLEICPNLATEMGVPLWHGGNDGFSETGIRGILDHANAILSGDGSSPQNQPAQLGRESR